MQIRTVFLIGLLCSGTRALGQDSLALSSGSTTQGGTAALNLSLTSPAGSEPAGIQWTLGYSSSDIQSITVAAGPAATAAGKSIACAGGLGSYQCLLTGINSNVVLDGVAATVNVTLSPTVTGGTSISLTNTLGASLGGSAITMAGTGGTIAVTGGTSPILTGLTCNPVSLVTPATSMCTVTLNQAAPSNTTVALSGNNAVVTVPLSVTVLAGATSATFSITAGVLSSAQAVAVTAKLATSSQSAILVLLPPMAVLSVQCNPLGLSSRIGSTCTVTLNQPAPSDTTVVLGCSNSTILTLPSSITIAAGTSSATFSATAATVTTGELVVLTATLGTSSQTGFLAVLPPLNVLSLACSPSLTFGGNGTCIVTMNRDVYNTRTVAVATSDSTALLAPPSVALLPGSSGSTFSITAGNVAGQYVVTASLAGLSESATVTVTGSQDLMRRSVSPHGCFPEAPIGAADPDRALAGDAGVPQSKTCIIKPVSLSCNPRVARAGDTITCEVQLNSAHIPEALQLRLISSSMEVKIPATITTRPMQSTLSFQGYTSLEAQQQSAVLQVVLGGNTAQDSVIILPSAKPVHTFPGKQMPNPVSTRGGGIPAQSSIRNDQGPVITALVNGASQSGTLACSPGAIASLAGTGLVRGTLAWSEPAGDTTQLGDAQVTVNGDPVPVLYASGKRVDFLCPSLPAGSNIQVSLENGSGKTSPIAATMLEASPGIFSIEGSGNGQGAVLFTGTSAVATVRNPVVFGEPAQPGDNLALRVTGVPTDALVYVQMGDIRVPGHVIQAVAGNAGVYEVLVTVPEGVAFGDAVPVRIQLVSAGGEVLESNVVTLAIEPVLP